MASLFLDQDEVQVVTWTLLRGNCVQGTNGQWFGSISPEWRISADESIEYLSALKRAA
jgi:hypothetical protein